AGSNCSRRTASSNSRTIERKVVKPGRITGGLNYRRSLKERAMQRTWILAADSSRARIFEALGSSPNFREIDDLANPPGRANNRELRTDAHGRYSGKGQGHHGHVTSPPVDAVEHETELFSKMLGHYLDKARS